MKTKNVEKAIRDFVKANGENHLYNAIRFDADNYWVSTSRLKSKGANLYVELDNKNVKFRDLQFRTQYELLKTIGFFNTITRKPLSNYEIKDTEKEHTWYEFNGKCYKFTLPNLIDFQTMEYLDPEDSEMYLYLVAIWPENEKYLREIGALKVKSNVRQYTITPHRNTPFEDIIEEFKQNGFNVTIDALKHNYEAWKGDYKSGYRDEENGYFLFTPCGCNPLRFDVETLYPTLEQQTYEA